MHIRGEAIDRAVEQLRRSDPIRLAGATVGAPNVGREGIGAVAAFNSLRDVARPSRRTVHDIARELVAERG